MLPTSSAPILRLNFRTYTANVTMVASQTTPKTMAATVLAETVTAGSPLLTKAVGDIEPILTKESTNLVGCLVSMDVYRARGSVVCAS